MKNEHSWAFKLALLSISILAMTTSSISAAVPLMQRSLHGQSLSQIESIITMPNFGSLLLIMFSGIIGKKLGIKRTIMLGLVLFLIGGITPALTNNYTVIMVTRFLMGCGVGLFNPFSVSLMYSFYQDDELSAMLGYQSSAQNLGAAGIGLLIAALLAFSWKLAFLSYLIVLIPLVLFGLFIKVPEQPARVDVKESGKANHKIWLLTLLVFLTFCAFMAVIIKLASLVTTEKIGTPSAAAVALSLMGVFSMVASGFFSQVNKRLGDYIMPTSLLGMALGMFLIATAKNMVLVFVGVFLVGLFFGWVLPRCFMRIDKVASKDAKHLSTSMILVSGSLGSFLSPILMNPLAQLFGNGSPSTVLMLGGAGMVLMTLVDFYFTFTGYYQPAAAK